MSLPVLFSIIVLAAPIAAAQQTTRPVDPEQERLAEIKNLEQQTASLPQLSADSIEQVVKFRIEENMLAARTSLRPADGQALVRVPGLAGFVLLSSFGPQEPGDQNAGRNFQLLQKDLTSREMGQVYTNISAIAGRLILARDAESERYVSSVQLVQDPPAPPGAGPEEDPVRLLVHRSDVTGRENDLDIKVSARDFIELRRRHPDEVDRYLRPIIADYQQEAAVFAIQPEVAWQVLGAAYAPDVPTQEKVAAIIGRLDADDFRQREQAMEDLKSMGQLAALAVAKMDRSKLSLQQNSGIDAFLAEFAPLGQGQTAGLSDDKGFLLDVLYNDDPQLRKLALDQLSRLTGGKVELDPHLDARARAGAVSQLRHKLLGPAPNPATSQRSTQDNAQ